MTTEAFDEKKAWDEMNREENPALAALHAIETRPPPEPQVDGEQHVEMPLSHEEQALLAARAAADEAAGIQPKADPTTGLTEQITALQQQMKDQNEAHQKALRDLNGRYGGVLRELEQVKKEATVAKAAAASSPPTQAAIAEAAKTPEKWAAFKREWEGSGITEAIEEFVAAQRPSESGTDVQQLLEERLAAQKAEYEERLAQQEAQLVELRMSVGRPGWREAVRSPEFAQWHAAQPPAIQALAKSPNPDDALEMLKLFDQSTATPAADKTKQNRERLAQAVHPTSPVHQPRKTLSIEEMTPQQLWAFEARMEALREGRAN